MSQGEISIQSIEWKSIALLALVYFLWYFLISISVKTSILWCAPFLAYIVALQTSLQHEFLHGHPTRNQTLNDWLVFLPLVIWLPYSSYKDSHLKHHKAERLADPNLDPESYYFLAETWQKMNKLTQAIYLFHNTFVGRMLVGPLVALINSILFEYKSIRVNGLAAIKQLMPYLIGLLIVISIIVSLGLSIWSYLFFVVWPATSLMLIRSYHEHKPESDNDRSTAIVETNPIFSLLFLNNNLHVVHHQHPELPWYQIPSIYHEKKQQVLQQNGGFLVNGYAEIWENYAFVPKDTPVY